jgi:c-di-GMP-binding flagellar brake protein YcgR
MKPKWLTSFWYNSCSKGLVDYTSGGWQMELVERNPSSEKRKYPRFDVDLPIKYSKSSLFPKYARAVNASEGGLLLHLPEELGVGQQLVLKLFFPPSPNLNVIETVVQVVWMDVRLRKDWAWDYQTGVRFLDISPEDMASLKNFLMNVAQEPICTA